MKRFKSKTSFGMKEDSNGKYVLFDDAAEVLRVAIDYAIAHKDDIENGVDDFGELKPLLEMVKSMVH